MKRILDEEKERFRAVREAFGIGDIDFRRAYVRAYADAPPFEVEYPAGLDVLDLIDHDIGVEEGLMRRMSRRFTHAL